MPVNASQRRSKSDILNAVEGILKCSFDHLEPKEIVPTPKEHFVFISEVGAHACHWVWEITCRCYLLKLIFLLLAVYKLIEFHLSLNRVTLLHLKGYSYESF